MYAEWIVISQLDLKYKFEAMNLWLESAPKDWGVPHLFQGFLYTKLGNQRELTAEEQQVQTNAYQTALDPTKILLPGMKEIAKVNLKRLQN